MRSITIIILVLLLSAFKSVAQDFAGCVPGYVSITVGDGTPGNPIQTYTNVPNICTASSSLSQPGLVPIGTHVRFTPPAHTGSVGQRIGTVIGYQWSLFPNNPTVELRYTIEFTPDANMYLDTTALLPGEFEVVSALENSNVTVVYKIREYGLQ